MIHSKKILAVIPARGGSKGIPKKNIRILSGKPLVVWTIEEAQKSKYVDRVILSSEDHEIIEVAKKYGCEVPFIRPKELAEDDTPGVDPVIHAVEKIPGYDYVVLLQPTSPLRRSEHIDRCIELCIQQRAPSCVSVTVPDKSPYWMYTLDKAQQMKPLINESRFIARRQDLPQVVALNGAVYVAECNWFLHHRTFLSEKTVAYVMPKESSIDIDRELDFVIAEALMNQDRE